MRNPIVTFIVGLVIGLAVAGGTFFLGINQGVVQGREEQAAAAASFGITPGQAGGAGGQGVFGGQGRQGGAGGFAGGAGRGNATVGVIKSISGNTITITPGNPFAAATAAAAATPVPDLTVTLGDSTAIVKQAQVTVADLKAGDRITVTGPRSGDNIAATNIQIIPDGALFGGPRADRTPGAAPTP
jgi:hypothetical protein